LVRPACVPSNIYVGRVVDLDSGVQLILPIWIYTYGFRPAPP